MLKCLHSSPLSVGVATTFRPKQAAAPPDIYPPPPERKYENLSLLTSNFKSGWCQLYTTITNII